MNTMLSRGLVPLLIFSSTVHLVAAATIEVSPIAGQDTPSCGGSSMPCRTLQYAIDLSTDGDVVLALSGTHGVQSIDGIRVNKTGLTVQGTHGAVVDCARQGRGFQILSKDSVLANLIIKNCALRDGTGGGILVSDETQIAQCSTIEEQNAARANCTHTPTLANLVVENCMAKEGGAIYVIGACPVLHNVTLRHNVASLKGGGILMVAIGKGETALRNSNIVNNTVSDDSDGLFGSPTLTSLPVVRVVQAMQSRRALCWTESYDLS